MDFNVTVLDCSWAAEVSGIDCSQALDSACVAALKELYLRYPVLIVHDQRLTAREFAAFIGSFGSLERTVLTQQQAAYARTFKPNKPEDSMLYIHPDSPDVYVMSNELRSDLQTVGVVDDAGAWHSDASHKPDPTQAIALYALQNPGSGGDTEFCNMTGLYEALSPDLKQTVDGAWASHHWSKGKNPRLAQQLDPATREEYARIERAIPDVRHPLVRTHPENGRRSLFISPRFTIGIDGFDAQASEQLLGELFAMVEDERFLYRHRWRDGDVVLWDNRCLIHRACGGYAADQVRVMYRVTLGGDRPFFEPAA